jgi:hypothetical protein
VGLPNVRDSFGGSADLWLRIWGVFAGWVVEVGGGCFCWGVPLFVFGVVFVVSCVLFSVAVFLLLNHFTWRFVISFVCSVGRSLASLAPSLPLCVTSFRYMHSV